MQDVLIQTAFPLRTLMQAVVVVKAMSRGFGVLPLSVEIVQGTSAEEHAWQKEAEKYLIAKAKGVLYKPEGRNWEQEYMQ